MGLSQSLYTGYSGMQTHQKGMNNLSNNLANINTVGFKKSDFMFTNLFNQAITGAIPGDNRGTTNPKGIGVGVTTGTIVTNFSSTNYESTGNPLNCAIGGNGFFMVDTGRGTGLTRNGDFYFSPTADGNQMLTVTGAALPVKGWNAVNGVVTPGTDVSNIIIPPTGSKLVGESTTEVEMKGILPTNPSKSDLSGNASTNLELKGNLPVGESSLTTQIYMPVTQTGGDNPVKDQVQPVNVKIDFQGPVLSEDGTTENYTWTMTTVDWPNPGDPGVQIYPTPDGTNQTVNFYTQGSATNNHGAGQSATGKQSTGPSTIESTVIGEDGEPVTTSFTVPGDFGIDFSRLTHLDDAPGGNELQTWNVNGNPTGSLPMSVTLFDEVTVFEPVTNENGITVMEPVRSVVRRTETMFFTKEDTEDDSTKWTWQSSPRGDTGDMTFDTSGKLVSSNQSGTHITYDLTDMQYINQDASLTIVSQDGYIDGVMNGVEIDETGTIWALHNNNVNTIVGQIAMANVPNTSGLVNSAGTIFYPSSASGDIMIGVAGDEKGSMGLPAIGAGSLIPRSLESSNVNLAEEFANMISVERGYQFSSRIITTANEMLQTALQLK